jgi:hypothetical protein
MNEAPTTWRQETGAGQRISTLPVVTALQIFRFFHKIIALGTCDPRPHWKYTMHRRYVERRRPPYVYTSTGICLLNQVSSHEPQKTSTASSPSVRSAKLPLLLLLTSNVGKRPVGIHGPTWHKSAKGQASEMHRGALDRATRWRLRNCYKHCSCVSLVQPYASR